MAVRYEYQRMTPEQLRAALAEVGLEPQEFARVSGWRVDYVHAWLHGDKEIPHQAFVFLSVLTLPGAVDLAKRVTNLVARVKDFKPEAEQ